MPASHKNRHWIGSPKAENKIAGGFPKKPSTALRGVFGLKDLFPERDLSPPPANAREELILEQSNRNRNESIRIKARGASISMPIPRRKIIISGF
jgi:hypothetical protein